MAIEDYFKGSSQAYGQLAGSLLAGRRKQDKKEAKRALIASTVMATFGALQNKQKQDIIDGAEAVNEKYTDIFTNNKEIFNNPINVRNRTNYQLYLEDDEKYLHDAAVSRFNTDPDLVRELGANPWLSVTKENLPEGDYDNLIDIYKGFKIDEKNKIKKLGEKPQVNMTTFTKFNEAAKNEFLNAMEAVKDDPRKQGLVREAWNRIFKTKKDDEGELISTNDKVIELTKNLNDSRVLRENQERLVSIDSSPENKENDELINIIEQNQENNNLDKVTYINTEIGRDTEFTTNIGKLKLEKNNFKIKVNKKGYEITEDDIGKAIEYNETIPGFPGLINITPSTRKDLLTALTKIKNNKNFRPFSAEVNLNVSEQRAYALALNQSPTAMLNNELKLRQTQAEINEVVNVAPDDVTKIYNNKVTKPRVESSVLSYMLNNKNNDTFNFEGNLSTVERNGFVYNVIEGALQLQGINKNLSFDDAVLQAIPIQATGIYKFKDKPFYKRKSKADIFRVEYVNMEVIDFMENKTLNDNRDAKTAVEYLNTKNYIQNRIVNEDTKETLVPAKDKEFIQDGFKFFTINVGNEAAPQYLWTYEKLPIQ